MKLFISPALRSLIVCFSVCHSAASLDDYKIGKAHLPAKDPFGQAFT